MKLALLCALSAAIPALLLAQPAPDTLWTWTYGGAGMERAVDVNPTSDGGLILAGGRSIGADLPDALLVKLTAAGDLEWTVNYGESSEEAFRVCQTADQGFVAVGYTTAGCMGQDLGNAYVIRLNAQGDSLWTRNLNFGTVDDLYGVLELNNGDILIAGSTVPIPGSVAPLLCRLNANGDSLWSHVYLHPNVVRWVRDLIQLNDGGFALAGFGNNPSGPTLPFALKVNADGDEEWLRTYERDLDADGHSIIEAQDDGFYLCGNGYNEDYQEGFLILRLNAQGAVELYREKTTPPGKPYLSARPPLVCPSADVFFHSLAQFYGPRALGIILTGMGSDGAEGLEALHHAGGLTIAQNEQSCVVYGMPHEAVKRKAVDQVLSPEQIAAVLNRFTPQPDKGGAQ